MSLKVIKAVLGIFCRRIHVCVIWRHWHKTLMVWMSVRSYVTVTLYISLCLLCSSFAGRYPLPLHLHILCPRAGPVRRGGGGLPEKAREVLQALLPVRADSQSRVAQAGRPSETQAEEEETVGPPCAQLPLTGTGGQGWIGSNNRWTSLIDVASPT